MGERTADEIIGDNSMRRYLIPLLQPDDYFGDAWSRGGKLPELGFTRDHHTTFLDIWKKTLVSGHKLSLQYDAQAKAPVRSKGEGSSAHQALTSYLIDVEFPNVNNGEKLPDVDHILETELNGLFQLAERIDVADLTFSGSSR